MASNTSIGDPITIVGAQWISDDLLYVFRVVNFAVTCQVIAVFGCITNIINMVVIFKMGFKDSINISLFALAISDLGSCLTTIGVSLVSNPWFQELDLPFEPDETLYLVFSWPHVVFTKSTTIITAFIAFERCLCVTIPLKVKTLINRRRVKVFVISTFLLMILFLIPIYSVQHLDWKFYPHLNKSLIGIVFTEHRQQVETVYLLLLNTFVTIFAFVFISVCTAVLVVSLKRKAEWRQNATSGNSSNETSSKEKRVVKMVVTISSLFIACFLPTLVLIVLMAVDREISITGTRDNFLKLCVSFILLAEAFNSGMNVLIYYYNSSNFRSTFDQVFRIKGKENK